MDISTSTTSSRRLSQDFSKYEKLLKDKDRDYPSWRVKRNSEQLKRLQRQINTTIKGSYAFTAGTKEMDGSYQKLFIDFFREMRGGDQLTNQSGWELAKTLCYEDIADRVERWVYEPEELDHLEITYRPTEAFKQELMDLLDQCGGFNAQFLEALGRNSKCLIKGLDLNQRDTYICSIPVFRRVFPRCYETLKAIFTDLLSSEWLQEDIHGIQEYTNQKIAVDRPLPLKHETWRLWNDAKEIGEKQKSRDKELAKKHENAWKNDLMSTAVSGALSCKTGNPVFIGSQLIRVITNAISRNTDPEGKDLELQMLSTVTNAGTSLVSGPSKALFAGLAFDLADLKSRHNERENGIEPSKGQEAGRNIAMTFAKSLLTGTIHEDEARYLKEIIGGLTSEVLHQIIQESDETTPWVARLLKVMAQHPDVQGQLIEKGFEKLATKKREPQTQEPPKEEAIKTEKPTSPFIETESLFQRKEPDLIQQEVQAKIAEIKDKISKQDQIIAVGQEHLNNLRKDWRVYKDETGKFVPMEQGKQAELDLDKARHERSGLEQELKSYQKLVVDPGMRDETRYHDLLRQKDLKEAELAAQSEKNRKLNKDYQEIHKEKKKLQDAHSNPVSYTKKKIKLPGVKKDCDHAKEKWQKGEKRFSEIQAEIHALDNAILEASVPKETPPMNSVSVVVDQRKIDKKHHHLSYVDDYGQKQSLGKYGNKQEAEGVGRQFTSLVVDRKSHEYECYDAQQRLLHQGVPLENLPTIPHFNLPTMTGNDFTGNMSTIAKATKEHNQAKDRYIEEAKKLAPIESQGLTASERHQIKQEIAPHIKNDPKEHGKAYKAYRAIGKGVDKLEKVLGKAGFSGEINALTVSGSHTNTGPSLIHLRTQSPKKRPTYGEMQHQINLERSELQSMEASRSQQRGSWNDVQSFQEQRMLQENMVFRSPELGQYTARPEISQQSANMGVLWGNGVARNVQALPKNTQQAIQAGRRQQRPQMQHASFGSSLMLSNTEAQMIERAVNNDFTKSVPKGVGKVAKALFGMMLPDMSDRSGVADPRGEFKKICHNLGKLYDKKVGIEDPESFASKSGEFVGEMLALGPIGKVVRVAEGVSVFARACEGGLYGAIISEAHDTNRVAGIAFGVAVNTLATRLLYRREMAQPLLDRVLVRPEGFGRQLRAIEALQSPVYRSGFVSEGTVANLSERQITRIQPMKLPYLKKGVDYEWFAKYSPRIDHFRRIHSDHPKNFYQAIRREFAPQKLDELKIRRTLKYAGFHTYERPLPSPVNVVVEFSKKNGGMSYRLAETTTDENLVVRVCPGLAKESIVSSVIKRKHLNGEMPGTLRQQYPYVVQSRGNLYRTIDGRWVRIDGQYKRNKALTHIPLEIYEFKGW